MVNRSKQIPRIAVREDFKEGAMHQAWKDSHSDCRQRIDDDIELSLKQKWDSDMYEHFEILPYKWRLCWWLVRS